jgi:HSP20 family protein
MKIKNLLPEVARRTRSDIDHPFHSLQREMNSLFDNFFRGFDVAPRGFAAGDAGVFSPSIDVKENEKEFIIKAELPGVEEKDIDVTVTNDSVTIKGEKKEEKEDKDKNYYYMERSYG